MERRELLRRSAAFFSVIAAGSLVTACGGDGDAQPDNGTVDNRPPQGTYVFGLGVASGDPRADSVVLWTRVQRSAAGDASDIALTLQVSGTADFAKPLVNQQLVASKVYDHTVRAKITGLQPDTRYYYRFVAGCDSSAVGTTRTAPAANAQRDQLRFAWFTCQDWSINHWAALDLLAAEADLDFTVHVGDYIYETVGAQFQTGQVEPAHKLITLPNGEKQADGSVSALTLEDYRTLYRSYRSDVRLQKVHGKFPLIAIWDDHEFSDDSWQDHQTYTNENKQQTARRRAANQAWYEYMPVDMGDVSFDLNNARYDNIRIYRDFQFGKLLHLVMTDERLYRDDHIVSEQLVAQQLQHDPVNGSDSIGSRYFVPRNNLLMLEALTTQKQSRAPSILGQKQSDWWKTTMKASTATWKVWGNEVSLSRMWLDLRQQAPAPYNQLYVINADGWDGYPAHKTELMGYLRDNSIRTVVAITGDLHAFQCGVIRDTFATDATGKPTGQPVMVDFVCAGISSSSFYSYLKAGAGNSPLAPLVSSPAVFEQVMRGNNPDLAYSDHHAQGYATATVTASQMEVRFHKVRPLDNGQAPASPLLQTTRITLGAGSTTPVIA